jgi:hypothetical protein
MAVRWRHKKTGNLYCIVGYVIIEKTLTPAVCYEPVSEPRAVFVRPCEEFFDGRFEMVNIMAKSVPPKEADPEEK